MTIDEHCLFTEHYVLTFETRANMFILCVSQSTVLSDVFKCIQDIICLLKRYGRYTLLSSQSQRFTVAAVHSRSGSHV